MTVSAHDLAVALGIQTDLVASVPRAAFEEREAALAKYMARRLRIWSGDLPCRPAPLAIDYAPLPDELVLRLSFACRAAVEWLVVSYRLFFDLDSQHRSIGVVHAGAGAQEFLFDRSFTTLEVEVGHPAPPVPFAQRFSRMLLLGVEHIASGFDHVLFVIALMLVIVRFWRLVTVVTAFTIAHSVTLTLAWFEVIDLSSRLVESLIALSIVYVAVENLFARGFGHRWAVAFGFGLVHGVGFYSVLNDIELARGDMVTTLFAFNLGVELGQLVIVALFYGALVWAARRDWYRRAMRGGSAAIAVVAAFWFVERTFLAGS